MSLTIDVTAREAVFMKNVSIDSYDRSARVKTQKSITEIHFAENVTVKKSN